MSIEYFIFEPLEPRTMLSADPLGLSEILYDPFKDENISSAAIDSDLILPAVASPLLPEPLKLLASEASNDPPETINQTFLNLSQARTTELIIIDNSIDNYQNLLASIDLNALDIHYEIQFINSKSDGISQLTEIMYQYSDLNAVHLFSHATQGAINLGNQQIDQTTLINNSEAITQWGVAFSDDADFLLYGCNLASGTYGVEFVGTLGELTKLDIAASDDLSGSSALQANWQLEHHVGNVSAQLQLSDTPAIWQGTLATPSIDNNKLVIAQGADITLSSTNILATGNPLLFGDSLYTRFTVFNIVGGYFAKSVDLATEITSFLQADVDLSNIHFIHDGGELAPAYEVVATFDPPLGSPQSSAASSASITFTNTDDGALWLAFDKIVPTDNGIPGLNNDVIDQGDIIQQAGPNASVGENNTNGSFATAFDIGLFSDSNATNGIHFVSSDISIGATNPITLQAGDLLLSSGSDMVLKSNGAGSPSNLTLSQDSIVYFRPDLIGDYSKGNFYKLLYDPLKDGAQITAVTLVERDVFVGDYQLKKGDFLFAKNSVSSQSDIWLFRSETIDTQLITSYPATLKFINGEDTGVNIAGNLSGIDILETDRNIGGINYTAGTVFVSIEQGDTDGIGTNLKAIKKYDIVALSITQSTAGSGANNAQATAAIFLDGDDVNFDNKAQAINSFSLTYAPDTANTAPILNNNNFTFNEGQTTTITTSALEATDIDNADSNIVFNISSSNGGEFQLASNLGVAINSFLQSDITNAEVIFVDDGNEIAPSFKISISDNVNITAPVDASISYFSLNDQPILSLNPIQSTFNEGSDPVLLFSGASADTVEAGQLFSALSFTVSNVNDSNDELLTLDDSALRLIDSSGVTSTNGLNYSISLSAGVASITLTSDSGMSANNLETLLNTLGYQNNSQDPTAGDRVITLTSLQDSGGTLNTGQDTLNTNISAAIDVIAINDKPTISLTANIANYTEQATPAVLFSNANVNPIEEDQTFNAFTFEISNVTDGEDEQLLFDNEVIKLINNSGTTITKNISYSVSLSAGTATLSLTADSINSATLQALINNMGYQNISDNPTSNSRMISLTNLQDNGGTLNNGENLLNTNIAANISVIAVNDAPLVLNSTFDIQQGQVVRLNSENFSIIDPDSTAESTRFNIIGITGGYFENTTAPGIKIISFSQSQINAGLINFVDDDNSIKPTVNFTISDEKVTTSAINATVNFNFIESQEELITQQIEFLLPAQVIDEILEEEIETIKESQKTTRLETIESTANVTSNNTNGAERVEEEAEQPKINSEIFLPTTTAKINQLSIAISAIVASNNQLAPNWSTLADPLLSSKSSNFLQGLDQVADSVERNITIDSIELGTGAVFSTGLSIGYVAWLLRSGIILTSVLSSLPAWRFIDPLPILSSLGSSDASQETLVDIVTDQNETNLLSPEALNLEGTAK